MQAETTISSDFDTFLQLLTAQIRNQDPLDPMKSEEFAVQLATFSNVEQSVRSNDLLEEILAGTGSDEFTAMSGWIGRDVRAPMAVAYQGEPIRVDPEPPIAGTRHELVVLDADGGEVDRRQIGSVGDAFEWSGTTANGAPAGNGTYSFTVESFEGDALVASEPASVYAPVLEVRQGQTGPTLAFSGGVEVDAATVTAVRQTP